MDKLMRLAGDVEDASTAGRIDAEAIADLSADLGVPAEKLYAGLAMGGNVQLTLESETQVVVCAGSCQDYGALECISTLLDLREDRLEDGEEAFDVVPRACLNRCQQAVAVEIRTKNGTAVVSDATPDALRSDVESLFED